MLGLLIDFGASRIKSAIFDTMASEKNAFTAVRNYSPAAPVFVDKGCYEISLVEIKQIFLGIVADYRKYKVEAIYICSEMHGFVLVDKNNNPVTEYISWKDERSAHAHEKTTYFDSLVEKLGDDFIKITGMKPKKCFPIFNLFAFLKENKINQDIKVLTLPCFLVGVGGKSQNIVHETMAAGTGFYDIFEHEYSKRLIDACKDGWGFDIKFNRTVSEIKVAGYVDEIPVYTGVGDHQCAVLGAGNDENTISFNLGTGSQISMICDKVETKADLRPFFGGKYLQTITHIPSGRAFNEYVGFIERLTGRKDIWDVFNNTSFETVENSDLEIDLAIFGSAANFENYKGIRNIKENSLTLDNYLGSLIRSYVKQYIALLGSFNIGKNKTKLILSGGISRKIKVLEQCFAKYLPYKIETVESVEDTFIGLAKLIKRLEIKNER